MGIPGLYSHVKDNKAYEICDLTKIASENKGIEILVDFNAYIRDVLELLSNKMTEEYNNKFLLFPSGEFDIIYDGLKDFHQVFHEAGIELVWIIDGPKGVDEASSDQKKETWSKRAKQDMERYNTVLKGCSHKLPPHDLNNLMANCTLDVCQIALKDAGAEIIQLLQGESDEFIALEFDKRNSYAIITNDTDFLIFPKCQVIFPRLMNDYYNAKKETLPFLDNENPGKFFKKPESFKCPIVTEEKMFQLFEFNTFDELVVLAIIKGCDNISEFSQELQYHLKITRSPEKRSHITHVVEYIKKHLLNINDILKYAPIKTFAEKCPKFIEAVKYCQEFYSLKRIKENIDKSIVVYKKDVFKDLLTDHFAEKMSNLQLWMDVYAIHYGTIVFPVYIESPSSTCDSITTVTSELRSRIYPYIVNERVHEVHEWQPRQTEPSVIVKVKHSKVKANNILGQPQIDVSYQDKYGIDIFDGIWSHLEKDGSLNFFKMFGLECGFNCYLLRYFYHITKKKNLKVSEDEFRALFITIFYHFSIFEQVSFNTKLKRESFLGLEICPSEKCFIIDTWFLILFYYGKYICGGALNLTRDFPSVQNVFNGTVFFAFYENIMNSKNERTSHLEETLKDSITGLGELILQNYKEQYQTVTK